MIENILKKDAEFESLIPAQTDEEHKALEQSLLKRGFDSAHPIITWQGIIVDGHNRYEICQIHKIPFTTLPKDEDFATREDVMNYIIDEQLARRNITPDQRAYLIGKRYESEKKVQGGLEGHQGLNQYTKPKESENPAPKEEKSAKGTKVVPLPKKVETKTKEKIAKETNTSQRTVINNAQFARTGRPINDPAPGPNLLYYGDNLPLLQDHDQFPNEFVDLIYIDPPFNSGENYNILYNDPMFPQKKSSAQIKVFDDMWDWGTKAEQNEELYRKLVESDNQRIANLIQGFRQILGTNSMFTYILYMTARIMELYRVLKPTGSFYLHCDYHADSYLRVVCNVIFNKNSNSVIIWKRTSSPKSTSTYYPMNTDTILFYSKTDKVYFKKIFKDTNESNFKKVEKETGRKYYSHGMTVKGNNPKILNINGKIITAPDGMRFRWNQDTLNVELEKNPYVIEWSSTGGLYSKTYLDESKGTPISNIWDDIPNIRDNCNESLGYPTQKPEALLERIINASSNEGDVILDCFCGCGTSISVAQKLNRRWIGIDITYGAIQVIIKRLIDTFGIESIPKVIGEPTTVSEAMQLAENDKYEFQWWALHLVDARPDPSSRKKGADSGIDGKRFIAIGDTGKPVQVIFSVKGGHGIPANSVRDLRGVIEREHAEIGVMISLAMPTKAMRTEAASAGTVKLGVDQTEYARIQLRTIEELLAGQTINVPKGKNADVTFARAAKATKATKARYRPLDAEPSEETDVLSQPEDEEK